MKKLRFNVKAFIIISVILLIVGILFVKGQEHSEMLVKYDKVSMNQFLDEVKGYELEDGVYKVTEEDPYLVFDMTGYGDGKVYGICLELDNVINMNYAKIYYGRDGKNFTELDTHTFYSSTDNKIEVISEQPSAFIRVDVDCDIAIDNMMIPYETSIKKADSTMDYVMAIFGALLMGVISGFLIKESYVMSFEAIRDYVKKNYKKILINVSIILGSAVLAYVVEKIYGVIKAREFVNKYRILVFFGVIAVAAFSYMYRKTVMKCLHIYAFVIIMLVGTVHVIGSPPAVGISFDDEIHYGRTSYLAWGADEKISAADCQLISYYLPVAFNKDVYHAGIREDWGDGLNQLDASTSVLVDTKSYEVTLKYIAYIPGAIGLNIARALDMTYTHAFMLGKWMGLLCYAFVIGLSIKILKHKGKIIVAMIGLIPTNLFIATTYNYDWWVTAFTILGISIFVSELQSERKITVKKMLLAVLCMVVGMLPKAVYFPLIFPMMLLKKDKYEKPWLCRAIVIFGMFFLLLTFLLPMLIGGAGTGDVRGGTGVNSSEQIKFILSNPLRYVDIMFTFIRSFLSLDTGKSYLTYMAYYGQSAYYGECMAVLVAAAIIDNSRFNKKHGESVIYKLGVLAGVIGSMVLVATSMYISFTTVGNSSVAGCQPRYIIPILMFAMYYLGNLKIDIPDETKSKFTVIGTAIMSWVFLYGIYDLCIGYYI